MANRTLSYFGRLVLPLTLCWIRTLNLLWRRAQLEGSVRRQSQHQQSQQPQGQKSVHDHDFLASWREERVGGSEVGQWQPRLTSTRRGTRSVPPNRLTLDILIRSGSWIVRWSIEYTCGSVRIMRVGSPSSMFLHIQEGQESRWINALVQRWKFKKTYAFPPPPLILYKYAWQSRSEWCGRYYMYLKHDPL